MKIFRIFPLMKSNILTLFLPENMTVREEPEGEGGTDQPVTLYSANTSTNIFIKSSQ